MGKTKTCPTCQTAVTVPDVVPPPVTKNVTPQPKPVSPVDVTSATVTAKSFCCDACGTPLKIPKNSRGHVQCPSCRNDCVLEGLAKNAEIADKENINCGVPLSASPSVLHRRLVSSLYEFPHIPLDTFDKTEVVRQEHHCAPAYIFYCNATASFTYESGTVVKQRVSEGETDKRYASTTTYTDTQWHGQNGSVSASLTMLAPG